MNRAFNAVFVLLGIISILGAVFLIYGMSIFEGNLDEVLAQSASGAVPLDPQSVQQIAAQAKGVLLLGKIWALVVIVASLSLIYYLIGDMRRQRSIVARKK